MSTHLARHKVNPRSRSTGTVVVRLVVDSSGKVLSREVTKSSGYPALDSAAVVSLDRASPFPPFSKAMRPEPIILSVPFRFVTR